MNSNIFLVYITGLTIISPALVISMDATYKAARKASIVSPEHGYEALMKGGITSMLNEFNEIINWVDISQFSEQFEEEFDQFWMNFDSD